MVLERTLGIIIPDIQEQYEKMPEHLLNLESDEIKNLLISMAGLMQMYNGAMKEVNTKLEVLDDEFQIKRKHNPIHHIECRIKSAKSIYEKIIKRGFEPSLESLKEHILDIAGIRVICNFLNDIYVVESLLLKQSDVTLVSRKDYIENPKENGYRSLHLVVKVPVFLTETTEKVPVEIQLRTTAMDYWANLEHKLRYKNKCDMKKYSDMLLDCANTLAETEKKMQHIQDNIDG